MHKNRHSASLEVTQSLAIEPLAARMFRWVKRLPSKVKGFYAGYPRLTQTYPPRKFPRWFPKPTFCLALFSYLVVIVLIAIATAGYQWVSIVTTSWNDTNSFWFNAFIPDSYRPQTRICAPHNFQIGDSQPH